jgi:hypothetical protein
LFLVPLQDSQIYNTLTAIARIEAPGQRVVSALQSLLTGHLLSSKKSTEKGSRINFPAAGSWDLHFSPAEGFSLDLSTKMEDKKMFLRLTGTAFIIEQLLIRET